MTLSEKWIVENIEQKMNFETDKQFLKPLEHSSFKKYLLIHKQRIN